MTTLNQKLEGRKIILKFEARNSLESKFKAEIKLLKPGQNFWGPTLRPKLRPGQL